jgi:hypothetical protein
MTTLRARVNPLFADETPEARSCRSTAGATVTSDSAFRLVPASGDDVTGEACPAGPTSEAVAA